MKRAYLIIIAMVVIMPALPGISQAADRDIDGYPDAVDNCPDDPNGDCQVDIRYCNVDRQGETTPLELAAGHQMDWDGDGKGDACDDYDVDTVPDYRDNCITVKNANQDASVCADADGDDIFDSDDNCMHAYNLEQEDTDVDGVGDWCDNCRFISNSDQADSDLDGVGDACKTTDQPNTSIGTEPKTNETTEKTTATAPKFNDGCSLAAGLQPGANSVFTLLGWLASVSLIAAQRRNKR